MGSVRSGSDGVIRASVSFAAEDYGVLQEIACRKRVSIAWVIREAVLQYLEPERKSRENATDRKPSE